MSTKKKKRTTPKKILIKEGTMYDAARLGDRSAIGKFLDHGVNINGMIDITSKKGTGQETMATPLYISLANDQEAAARLLLSRGADPNIPDSALGTPLMLAAGKGQLSLLRRLIEAKANVNAQDSDGWTALHLAAGGGDADCSEILLRAGADTTIKNKDGETAPGAPPLPALPRAALPAVAQPLSHAPTRR